MNDYHPVQMTSVHRARVPASIYVVFAVALLIGVVVISHFYIQIRGPEDSLTKAQQGVRVWATKSTGFYYCFDSQNYGRGEGGQYMTQQEARQGGYTPALKEPCR